MKKGLKFPRQRAYASSHTPRTLDEQLIADGYDPIVDRRDGLTLNNDDYQFSGFRQTPKIDGGDRVDDGGFDHRENGALDAVWEGKD